MRLAIAALALLMAATAAMADAFFPAIPESAVPPADLWIDFTRNYVQSAACTGPTSKCLTVVRNTARMCDYKNGTWISVGVNQLCMTDKGALIEEARTNFIPNNSWTGAVPGTPGTPPASIAISPSAGLTSQIVGVGTESGIDYADVRFFGTASSTVSSIYLAGQVAATTSQNWNESIFLKLVGGTLTNVLSHRLYVIQLDSGLSVISNLAGPAITPNANPLTAQRSNAQFTTDPTLVAFVRPWLVINHNAAAVDFTIRVGWPQAEVGAFVTSPIRTTGASQLRNLDIVTVTTPPSLTGPLSAYIAMTPTWVTNASTTYSILSMDTGSNSIFLRQSSLIGGADLVQVAAGASVVDTGSYAMAVGGNYKLAFASAVDDVAYTVNGAALQTDNLAAFPSGMNRVGWNVILTTNQYTRQMGLWSGTRLTNAQLQAITAPSPVSLTPDVWLDFTSNNAVGCLTGSLAANCLTTARASSHWCDDKSGNWTSVGANLPCMTDKGLLIEDARTNSIRNSAGVGAVPGTPGTPPTNWTVSAASTGLASQIVGTGVENGIDYVDVRFFGTVTTAGAVQISTEGTKGAVPATSGQTWIHSNFLKLVAGTTTNTSAWQIILVGWDSGGVYTGNINAGSTIGLPTSTLQRYVISGVPGGVTASITTQIYMPVSLGAVDFTLRIGWPQLELGSFVTSPIRTTGAAVTRAADVVTMTSPPLFGSAFSFYGAGTPLLSIADATTNRAIVFADDSTVNNRILLYRGIAGVLKTHETVAGVQTILTPAGTWGQGVAGKIALAASSGDLAGVFSGGAVVTSVPAGVATNLNRVCIGCIAPGGQWQGYITQVGIWTNVRLPNSVLQGLTQ